MNKETILKIAALNDILEIELNTGNIDSVINPEMKSKLRNLKKSVNVFSKHINDLFQEQGIQEAFGDFCDDLNAQINNKIKEIKL